VSQPWLVVSAAVTVSARLVRIEALLGVDLKMPDDRLALHLACRTSIADVSRLDPQP
jgi:hypothetical protein